MWVYVETGYYAFNILFVYIYFKHLKVRGREDFRFMIANCVLNVIHSAWLVYGNVIYFKYNYMCTDENNNPKTSNALVWIMLALVIFGYVALIKCCTFSTLIICFGPMIYRSIRRARRPDADWVPTSRNLMKHVMKCKFNPD